MCRFWEDYFKWRKESRLQMIIMWKIIFWYISYLVNKVKADVFTSKYSTVSKFYTKKRLNSQFFVPKLTPPPRAVADWPFSSQLTSLMGCFNAHKIQVTTSLYWTLSLTYVRWARKTIKKWKMKKKNVTVAELRLKKYPWMFLVPSLVSFRLFSPPCIQTRTQKHVCSVVKELPAGKTTCQTLWSLWGESPSHYPNEEFSS